MTEESLKPEAQRLQQQRKFLIIHLLPKNDFYKEQQPCRCPQGCDVWKAVRSSAQGLPQTPMDITTPSSAPLGEWHGVGATPPP